MPATANDPRQRRPGMAHRLHHRREFENIRSAYDSKQSHPTTASSDSDSDASYEDRSSGSDGSYYTQPTEYSSSPTKRPPYLHQNACDQADREKRPTQRFFYDRQPQASPASSVETYASTVESEDDLQEEELPAYHVPESTARPYESCAIPATPSDFSELFPSHRRLTVRHDDSTLDGNMNLRVDTEVSSYGRRRDMTLFHLRMHDLRNREFSLRRYCRDSGREVCHSSCKIQKPTVQRRPGFQRSVSNALTTMRSKSEHRPPTLASLKRNDSGYGSMHSVDFDEDERPWSAGHGAQTPQQLSADNIKLEFSNYAQVDIRRVKAHSRHEFEYWGTTYHWKRNVRKNGARKEVSYHLTKAGSEHVLAYILPTHLSTAQVEEEGDKGGWIPPCSMWIADDHIVRGQKDVSDVVIASGLIALVDDSIRARLRSKKTTHLTIPLAKMQMGVEYIGPRRLINEMFRRDTGSNHPSRPSSSSRPSSRSSSATASRIPTGRGRQSSYEY